MRNIVILISAVLILALTGCSDFLKERQSTTYDGAGLVSSESALEASVFGIHKQMASSGFKSGSFCEWLAPASGLAHWSNTSALANALERWACCLNFTRYSKHPDAYSSFAGFYKTIYLCNSILDIIDNSGVSESFKNEIKGEIYFLRAMAYFYLVRLYGNVSLYLTAPDSVDDRLYEPRMDFRIVYGLILKDLDRAEAMMRDYDEMIAAVRKCVGSNDGGNASGRVCKHAAVACRSLVYLTIGTLMNSASDNFWTWEIPDVSKWPVDPEDGEKILPWGGISNPKEAFEKSLEDAETLIPESARFDQESPFRLCDDYRQLFRWTNPEDYQLAERIYVMPRAPESNDGGSALSQWALPRGYMGTSEASTFGRCRPDRWFFQEWCRRKDGARGKGGNNKNIYVDCDDPRLKTNIIYGSYIGEEFKEYTCYPHNGRIHTTTESSMKIYGMPYYGKYYDPTYNNNVGNADLYVMRLAEVYLIAAESAAYLNDLPTAIKYVNRILERARNSTDGAPASQPAAWDLGDFNQKSLLEAIFWERCFEMPFEHHEYFDTHRNGAQWLIDMIAIPKNAFLTSTEQADKDGNRGYRSIYYGKDFLYNVDVPSVRKGLVNSYPYDELVYNSCLNVNVHDPFIGQNPLEVYWK